MAQEDTNSTSGGISDVESIVLSAYLDGELSEEERKAVWMRLQSDTSAASELDSMRTVKAEFSSWLRESAAAETAKFDLWAALEPQLRAEKARRENQFSFREFFSSLLSPNVGWNAFAAGFACALLLVITVSDRTHFFGRAEEQSAEPQYASLAPVGAAASSRGSVEYELTREVPVLPFFDPHARLSDESRYGIGDAHLTVPGISENAASVEAVAEVNSKRWVPEDLKSFAPQLFRAGLPQLDEGSQLIVPGGFRSAGGSEIEWIKSDHAFRIVTPRTHNLPPVIWVSDE